MRKSFVLIAVVLASIVVIPGGALAMSMEDGYNACRLWGGSWKWKANVWCPFCVGCNACIPSVNFCIDITCDWRSCDEIVLRRKAISSTSRRAR
jgi:hypothetical protein